MAQNFLKLTGNVHLGSIMPKNNSQVDWSVVGISPDKMKVSCVQGHKTSDLVESDFRQYLPIEDSNNLELIKIIDAVNNDEYPDNSACIVNALEYDAKTKIIKTAKVALKDL